MATNYTWSINAMFTVNKPDPNYVVNVLWTLTGVDGQTTASIGGSTQFEQNQANSGFTPYDQLTEAMVIGWVQASLGETNIANYEANVQGQIDSILNPPVSPQDTRLPWLPPVPPVVYEPIPDISAPSA